MAERVELQIGANADQAEDELKGLDKFFETTAKKMENVEKRVAAFAQRRGLSTVGGAALGAAGQLTGQISAAASDPTQGFASETAGGIAKNIASKLPVIGEAAAAVVGVFTDALEAKAKAVEGQAGRDVQGIIANFAKAGIAIEDKDIKDLLDHFRGQNKRVFDSMRQVAKVQDQSSNTFMGYIGTWVRRGQDLVM